MNIKFACMRMTWRECAYRLQVHILVLHAQYVKISAKLSTMELEYKLA